MSELQSTLAEATPAQHAQPVLLPPLEVDDAQLRRGVEAILFIAEEPVSQGALVETLGVAAARITAAIEALQRDYAARDSGVMLVEVAGGLRLVTDDASRDVLERWIIGARHGRLTQAALETLAVIAYRQPIGRATIGEIRGVNPDGALRSLVARGLVAEVGREESPGQPVLFGTTAQFLERMGLATLAQLPPVPAFLPDGPAPDEPDASGLSELRRRLRDGSHRLGAAQLVAGAGGMPLDTEDEDDGGLPAPSRQRPKDDVEIVALSDRLEQAARSAMGRLRVVRSTEEAPGEGTAQDETDAGTPSVDDGRTESGRPSAEHDG
jgi:segregation and condensation protein B